MTERPVYLLTEAGELLLDEDGCPFLIAVEIEEGFKVSRAKRRVQYLEPSNDEAILLMLGVL